MEDQNTSNFIVFLWRPDVSLTPSILIFRKLLHLSSDGSWSLHLACPANTIIKAKTHLVVPRVHRTWMTRLDHPKATGISELVIAASRQLCYSQTMAREHLTLNVSTTWCWNQGNKGNEFGHSWILLVWAGNMMSSLGNSRDCSRENP
jgi:hypothetical protein